MPSDIPYILSAMSFSDDELNAISYAQYIANGTAEPVDEEFSEYEKTYYKCMSINALTRNINIYKVGCYVLLMILRPYRT